MLYLTGTSNDNPKNNVSENIRPKKTINSEIASLFCLIFFTIPMLFFGLSVILYGHEYICCYADLVINDCLLILNSHKSNM